MNFVKKINSIFKVEKTREAECPEITKENENPEIWTVSWKTTRSRYGTIVEWGDRAFKVLFNEDDANDFAESLRAANNLLQNGTNIDISINKGQ